MPVRPLAPDCAHVACHNTLTSSKIGLAPELYCSSSKIVCDLNLCLLAGPPTTLSLGTAIYFSSSTASLAVTCVMVSRSAEVLLTYTYMDHIHYVQRAPESHLPCSKCVVACKPAHRFTCHAFLTGCKQAFEVQITCSLCECCEA